MGNLLTAVSNQFAKAVILGTLFPVVIVSGLNLFLIAPLFSFGPALLDRIKRIALGEASWSVVALTFAVFVATGVLYNLNIPIIRLYEGYPWKKSWIGQRLLTPWEEFWWRATKLRLTLRYLSRMLRKHNDKHPLLSAASGQQRALADIVDDTLPERGDLVLPTRLGNVIRSFERYPAVAYDMEAIVIWPRLVSQIDTTFAATIDEAKTAFDFMLNCSFLSALTACAATALWLRDSSAIWSARSADWLWRVVFFVSLAILFYRASIGAAAEWGAQVRSAFDLYRFKLLSALGYAQRPSSPSEERALWQEISLTLSSPDQREPSPPYKSPPTRVVVTPHSVKLKVTRTLAPRTFGLIDVTVTIENNYLGRQNADDVLLVETIPEGYNYITGSFSCSVATASVEDLKPLEIRVGAIAIDATVTVKYTIGTGSTAS